MLKNLNYPLNELDQNVGFYFSEALKRPLAKPYWIFISLSHQCNFNCQMCGVKKVLKEHELDFDTLKRALDEIAGWGSDCVVLFTGGEPFLRKDIFDIINYSVSKGIKTEVVNNGSLINNPQIAGKVVESGLKNIAISLDGANYQTHDHIRGVPGAFKKAVSAFGYLREEKKRRGSGPQISMWTTIMKENVEELDEMLFLAEDLGVECLVYHPVIVTQEDMQNTLKSGHFWVTDDQLNTLKSKIDKLVEYKTKNGMVAFLHDPYLWLKYFQGAVTKNDWKCNPFVFIDIGPDGFVRSCGPAFGNIKELSLTECLHTKEAKCARERMLLCQKPCLQTCWGWQEAVSLVDITKSFISKVDSSDGKNVDKKKIINEGIELLDRYNRIVIEDYKAKND